MTNLMMPRYFILIIHEDLALSILLAGILCIYINYDCDRQRQEFRRTNGKCSIWGKAPSKIVASYQTTNGETKSSLLLTSGWWGLSRHFHYVPEILSAFFWTVPALFDHFLPYFYVIFLTILLFDRAKRDDDRCSSKIRFGLIGFNLLSLLYPTLTQMSQRCRQIVIFLVSSLIGEMIAGS
ncbi:hypothetical protein OsI_07143 [Oryza sativa Indica Group]|uniref:7-dehydrocholesterol reductase n=1 Tax=Oryza sativa subsp. indica TaxID=39946 RepID=A2X4M3_ORYSI|nr:hypothetical protein OsI_07143 [Oryza sativa Indica Group]